MEGAQYNRNSRARVAETAKDASRHATPCNAGRAGVHRPSEALHPTRSSDVLSRIARERVPTCHALRKTRRNVPLHQGFFAEMQSIHPHSGSNPRVLCLTNVYFGQQLPALL